MQLKTFKATKPHHTKEFIEVANTLLEAEHEINMEIKKARKDFEVLALSELDPADSYDLEVIEELGIGVH